MKINTKFILATLLVATPFIAYAANNILLYKHHSITEGNWKNAAQKFENVIDPNGDGDYSDSGWTNQEAMNTAVEDSSDDAPTAPTFTAEVFDATNASLGNL